MAVPDWRKISRDELAMIRRGQPLLVVRDDGKGYYGVLSDLTPNFFELANGNHRQIVAFSTVGSFACIDPPKRKIPTMADRRLPFES